MNNENILRMAKEAGFAGVDGLILCGNKSDLKKFTALVQAATAEECAKVCEGMPENKYYHPLSREQEHAELVRHNAGNECAQAIRTKYQDQTKSSGENNG